MIFTVRLVAAGLAARTTDAGLPQVGYDALVRLPLGSTRLIHGEHGSCVGPPPSWREMQARIPISGLGMFDDGGLAAKMVNDCGRELTVRAVRFIALKSGIEELTLLDDYMRVEVFELPDQAASGKPARR